MTTNYKEYAKAKCFTYGYDLISWLSDYEENEIGSNDSLYIDEADFNLSFAYLIHSNDKHLYY